MLSVVVALPLNHLEQLPRHAAITAVLVCLDVLTSMADALWYVIPISLAGCGLGEAFAAVSKAGSTRPLILGPDGRDR